MKKINIFKLFDKWNLIITKANINIFKCIQIKMSSERNEIVLSLSGSPRSNIPGIGVRLVEGILNVNTSKIGSMNTYAKIQYGDQI